MGFFPHYSSRLVFRYFHSSRLMLVFLLIRLPFFAISLFSLFLGFFKGEATELCL